LLQADEPKGAGADGMKAELRAAAAGHNSKCPVGEVPQQRCEGFFEMEDDCGGIGRINGGDILIGRAPGAADGAVEHGVDAPLDIAGGEQAPIVKTNPTSQMKDVGEWVGNLPALRQAGLQVEMRIAPEEGIEEQHVDAFGLAIGSNARVEIGRAALDDHDQGARIGRAGAGDNESRNEQRDCQA